LPSRSPPLRSSQENPSKRARRQRPHRSLGLQFSVPEPLRKACVPGFSELGFRTQARRPLMTHKPGWALAFLFSFVSLFTFNPLAPTASAQVDTIVIPAGTPEDNDLNTIGNEHDAQKKVSMYQDFLQ